VRKVLACLALGAAMTFGAAGAASADAVVAVVNPPCTLVVDGAGCLFSGNINLTNKLLETETAYNAQTNPDIELTDLLKAEFDAPVGPDIFSGTITAPFLVSFYAVKGGNQFILYQITPTTTFDWDTNDLFVGSGNHPGLSHVVYLGEPCPERGCSENPGGGPVPEPATWAMMLVGFGGMGAILRRTRRQARVTLA
jgi:hypothetical protein